MDNQRDKQRAEKLKEIQTHFKNSYGILPDRTREFGIFLLEEIERLQKEISSHGPEGRNYTNMQYVNLMGERHRLIEGLREARSIFDKREKEAWKRWDCTADLYEQGRAGAFEECERIVVAILKEVGVTDETPNDSGCCYMDAGK